MQNLSYYAKEIFWILILIMSFPDYSNYFFQKIHAGTKSVSNSLDPDQDQHSVSHDLGPICLQSLSADDKSGH